ncbi:MAG: FAD-dependent oxidoreductase [Desulfuromonadaceae bacterium]|nr:FAD-dependent oxidoreductase [Desulfuromonadaceae bacterium]
MNSIKQRILIIGGVAAGMKTACRLRRLDPDVDIKVIDRTGNISYGACPLPYYIEGLYDDIYEVRKTPTGVLRDESFFARIKGFETLTYTEALKINRTEKTVLIRHLDSGKVVELGYDKLVMATGNEPIMPPLPGMDLPGVLPLKTMEQAQEIDRLAHEGKNAVIIGAGLIGLEMAEALSVRGLNVTLIEMKDQVLATSLDFNMAAMVHRELRRNNVNLRLAEPLERIEGREHVTAVVTSKGSYPADLVLVAVGVRPAVQLAKDAGVDLGTTGAIAVNAYMQSSDPDIYAAGDCAECTDLLSNKKVYTPLGSTANKHGRVVANNIAGRYEQFPGILGSLAVKVFDLNVARTGMSSVDARLIGLNPESIVVSAFDFAHLYPGNKPIVVKLIAERTTRKILGAQVAGPGVVDKRADVIATAITLGATIDQLAQLDLCYAPPFSNAMDVLHQAANAMRNKLDGLAESLSAVAVKQMLDKNVNFIFLDVRSPAEHAKLKIKGATLLPLGALRQKLTDLPINTLIVPFCQMSLRGYEAQLILQQAGFRNVRYMEGGILGWPYELEQ